MWAWCSALPGYNTEVLRRRLLFEGQVQGVGFRWRARMAAQSIGLTGWVQNLADGSVEMELQGTEQQMDKLLLTLESSPYIRIENMHSRDLPLVQGEYGFDVTGY